MRKAINTVALIYFLWLVLDAFQVPSILLNFLITGELPIIKVILPAGIMLALMVTTATIIVLELLTRRIPTLRHMRRALSVRIRTVFSRTAQPLDAA